MTLVWPWMLLSLLLLPIWLFFYGRAQGQRQQRLADLGPLGLLHDSRGNALSWQRHLPMAFYLAGLGLLLFAVARPHMPLSLPRIEGTIILAFDVSASMDATDLEPSRMEAAKTAAIAFIQQQPSTVRIGVVSFSEGGLVVQPPTNNEIDLLDAINRLAPQSGTSLGQGILAGLNIIISADAPSQAIDDDPDDDSATPVPTALPSGSFDDAAIVLITDGENMSEPDPLDAAERTADYGVRIHTVGLGTTAGTTLEIDGYTVATRLNEDLLEEISDITNGTYYNAVVSEDLTPIYQDLARQLVMRPEETEVTALFAGLSIICLLVGACFSLLWFGRLP